MRVLGIDWGRVRLGLAMSDPGRVIASPFRTMKRKNDRLDIEKLIKLAAENEVSEIVIGIPLDMEGEVGDVASEVKSFAEQLKNSFEGSVHLVDERYSTHAAERSLLEADLSRKKRKELRDGVAAAWILQTYLDSRGRTGGAPE